MDINIHLREALERDEWWNDVEEERTIDDIHAPYPTHEIVAQMARRIAYQIIMLEGDPTINSERTIAMQKEDGKSVLSDEWLMIADEWCRDHGLEIGHGIMALLHFRSIFGGWWDSIELRIILDDAFEQAKGIEIFNR